MTDKEILQKVLDKAIKNGYKPHWIYSPSYTYQILSVAGDTVFYKIVESDDVFQDSIRGFVLSHDFAKAFWGDKLLIVDEHYKSERVEKNDTQAPYSLYPDYIQSWKLKFPEWKFYLREMSLKEEPLKYLEEFLQ